MYDLIDKKWEKYLPFPIPHNEEELEKLGWSENTLEEFKKQTLYTVLYDNLNGKFLPINESFEKVFELSKKTDKDNENKTVLFKFNRKDGVMKLYYEQSKAILKPTPALFELANQLGIVGNNYDGDYDEVYIRKFFKKLGFKKFKKPKIKEYNYWWY